MPTTRYVFVVNNYTPAHIARLNVHDNWSYITYSKEGGKSKEQIAMISEMYGIDMKIKPNTPHLQGYIELFKRQKLLTFFGKELSSWWFHPAQGTYQENINYIEKGQYKEDGTLDETNIYRRGLPKEPKQGQRTDLLKLKDAIDEGTSYEDLVTNEEHFGTCARHTNFVKEYIKIVRTKKQKEQLTESLFANFEPREWQQELLDILSQDPDPRHVHWIWDAVGNQGKSYMAKYLSVTQGATILKCAGTKTDLAYICSEQLSRTYIFDLSRTLEKRDGGSTTSYDPMDKVYEIMEDLKAGDLQSTKYHSHSGPIPVPHVVVFANFPPNKEKMSKDRWRIRRLDNTVDLGLDGVERMVRD